MDIANCAGHPLGWKQTRPTEGRSHPQTHGSEATILAFHGAPVLQPADEPLAGDPAPSPADFRPTSIALRATGTDTELAVYTPDTWSAGGTLAFPNGRTIRVTTRMR